MGDVRMTLASVWPDMFESGRTMSTAEWMAARDKITDDGWLTVFSSATSFGFDGPGWMALEHPHLPNSALLVWFS